MDDKYITQIRKLAGFIWNIADDNLRDRIDKLQYRNVLLPMTVLRRFDVILAPTKQKVLAMKSTLDLNGNLSEEEMAGALCVASGHPFYNTSPYTLNDLRSRTNSSQLIDDFTEYLDGYSPNIKTILKNFEFLELAKKINEFGKLDGIITRFCRTDINLSPYDIKNEKGEVLPGLDNHMIGTLYEEILRKFNDESNAAAGAYFTPRDVVQLMADLIFIPISNKIENATYSLYDGACGTGGMLTVGEDRLMELSRDNGKKISVFLFGQETVPEVFAICQSDLLIKGKGDDAQRITLGSTISEDGFPNSEFDFMMSNPPYGTSWSDDLEIMTGYSNDKKDIADSRFIVMDKGKELRMLQPSDDGQLLFLANNISKMKNKTKLGSRIAEVHDGSSLFSGKAGSGQSNFRKYVLEQDLLEAVIALPENMFYNTPMATYIWLLANKKDENRKGKVQLIDATSFTTQLRQNLGRKNCEISDKHKKKILEIHESFIDSEYSKIFNNADFGYWEIVTYKPKYDISGNILKDKDGKIIANPDTKIQEEIPLTYPGGIEAYINKELIPSFPDIIYDLKKVKIGYKISFKKAFPNVVKHRSIHTIISDIRNLETETDGMLDELILKYTEVEKC